MTFLTDFERDALAQIDSVRVVPLLQEIMRIPSVGKEDGEGRIAAYVADYLSGFQIDVALEEVRPGRPNVVGKVGSGGGPVLLFNSHMDTVPPGEGWQHDPYGAELQGGRIYGRGAVDDKGPLAAMLVASSVFAELAGKCFGQLAVCAVIDEENASLGSKDLMQHLRGDFGLVGEPTDGNIVIAHNGSLRPVMKVTGRVAHTSRPEDGINAISKMAKVVEAIDDLHVSLRKRTHPLTGSASACVSMIEGGTQPNLIPDSCTALLDRRMTPGEDEAEALGELETLFDSLRVSDRDLDVRIEQLQATTGGPSEVDAESEIVKRVSEAASGVLGATPALKGLGGACDMVHLVNAGVQTVVFGPGNPTLAHQVDEFIEVDELVKCSQVYLLVALRLLGRAKEVSS